MTTAPAGLPPPSHLILFIYSLSEYEQPSHGILPLLFFVTFFNNNSNFIIFIINIPRVSSDRANYGTVCTRTCYGYSVCGYGYSVGNPDPRYTRAKP